MRRRDFLGLLGGVAGAAAAAPASGVVMRPQMFANTGRDVKYFPNGGSIAVAGDSLTAFNYGPPLYSWTEQLDSRWSVQNIARNGTKNSEWATETNGTDAKLNSVTGNPDVFAYMIGVNDALGGDWLEAPFKANYNTFLDDVVFTRWPNTLFLPIISPPYYGTVEDRQRAMNRFRHAILEVFDERPTQMLGLVIDTAGANANVQEGNMHDQIHYELAGAIEIGQYVNNRLNGTAIC